MSTFTWKPSYGTDLTDKPRVLAAKFGDGYEQRAPDGINNAPEVWSLSFSGSLAAKITAARQFLKSHSSAGTSFDWTSPIGTVGKFKCEEYSFRLLAPGVGSLSAKFEQVFE